MNHRWTTALAAKGVVCRLAGMRSGLGIRRPIPIHGGNSWFQLRSTCDPFSSGDARNGEVSLLWINYAVYSGLSSCYYTVVYQ